MSGVIVDIELDFDAGIEERSISELIWMLRPSFQDKDFKKVESILMKREEKLREELETMVRANDWLNEKLEERGMIKHKAETDRDKLIEQVEFWKKKYEGLELRIRQLDAEVKLLASDARVSSQSGNNVINETPPAATATAQGSIYASRRPPSGNIIRISESDDDCASGEFFGRNNVPPLRVAKSDCSTQTGAQCSTGMLKRKHGSCSNVNENKISNTCGVMDDTVDDNSLTADCEVSKIRKLSHGQDVSPINHCQQMAVFSGNEKIYTQSNQQAVLGQHEKKMGAEHGIQEFMRELCLDVPGISNIDCSSSSSSSSSGSESDVDLDFNFPQFTRIINYKKWESESELLAAFDQDNELCLKAVCALYRQQTTMRKSPRSSLSNQVSALESSSNDRGFNQVHAQRGTALAEYLIDGDSQGKLRKSVTQLLEHDPKGPDDCKKIAFDHSKQLFEIYQKKEDPLFIP